jgi:hypothetical protein
LLYQISVARKRIFWFCLMLVNVCFGNCLL